MRYFELRDHIAAIPERWHVGSIVNAEGDEPALGRGLLCGDHMLRAMVSKSGVELDFFLTSFNVPIARARLAERIRSLAADDVQCIPVDIDGQNDFAAINVVRIVSCVDEEGSEEVKRWTESDARPDRLGGYRSIIGLKLRSGTIPSGTHVFRVSGWLVTLVVSEEMKRASVDVIPLFLVRPSFGQDGVDGHRAAILSMDRR